MPSGIVQFSDGFDATAFTPISNDGADAGALATYAPGIFGCCQILAPSMLGMRITGIEGSVDTSGAFPRGVRLAIISFAGQPNNATGILAQRPFDDAATLTGGVFTGGMLAGAFSNGALTTAVPGAVAALAPDLTMGLSPANPAGVTIKRQSFLVHYDETLSPLITGGGPGSLARFFGDGRGGIVIRPNRTAIALFIAARVIASGNALAATSQFQSVRGQVHGYQLTDADVLVTGRPTGETPGRFGNVAVPQAAPTKNFR